ncbi:hypothetical protein [Castellaniella sp.]|uniref:hypothetical protein n=1 Tax=Castellaniella sp. TaxID=1955812 RepID=UPI002AFE8874|nr:hypothetical protein [Castellaniella sp.]
MAFIIKKNKFSARIIRRTYVPKGMQDNTHSFFEDTTVGNIPLAATELPPGFPALTEHEFGRVESSVFEPARQLAITQRLAEAEHEADPVWRVMEAMKWIGEAAARSENRPLAADVGQDLLAAMQSLKTNEPYSAPATRDPLEAVSAAARAAIIAIKDGCYGTNNAGSSMKDSPAAIAWAKVRAVVLDDGTGSVKGALQEKGWVKSRGRGQF